MRRKTLHLTPPETEPVSCLSAPQVGQGRKCTLVKLSRPADIATIVFPTGKYISEASEKHCNTSTVKEEIRPS